MLNSFNSCWAKDLTHSKTKSYKIFCFYFQVLILRLAPTEIGLCLLQWPPPLRHQSMKWEKWKWNAGWGRFLLGSQEKLSWKNNLVDKFCFDLRVQLGSARFFPPTPDRLGCPGGIVSLFYPSLIEPILAHLLEPSGLFYNIIHWTL